MKPIRPRWARMTHRVRREARRPTGGIQTSELAEGVPHGALRRARLAPEQVGGCTHKLDLGDQCYHVVRRFRMGGHVLTMCWSWTDRLS